MQNIKKIIKETDFLVQKKQGGWKGFNIFLRHDIWSKFSVEKITDKKPRLTSKLKEKLVRMAITERENEKHNSPILSSINYGCIRKNCLSSTVGSALLNEKVMDKFREFLVSEEGTEEFDNILKAFLILRLIDLDIKEDSDKLKPRIKRVI